MAYRLRNMLLKTLIPMFMYGMTFTDLTQAITHQEFVVTRSKKSCWDVDQDCDPAVIHVAEGLSSEEDSGDNSCTKVTRQIRRDGDICKSPYHSGIGKTDSEGCRLSRDERIGRVKRRPDDKTDVGIYEEFREEEISKISGK